MKPALILMTALVVAVVMATVACSSQPLTKDQQEEFDDDRECAYETANVESKYTYLTNGRLTGLERDAIYNKCRAKLRSGRYAAAHPETLTPPAPPPPPKKKLKHPTECERHPEWHLPCVKD